MFQQLGSAPCCRLNEQRHSAMEVQLLHGPDGKVIFLECGSDFVEVMFDIMKTPLSSLLGVCPMQQEKEQQHPLLAMRKSLCDLGKQSFVGERPDDAVPKAISISEIMKTATTTTPNGYRTNPNGSLACTSCNYVFNPHGNLGYEQQCPHCRCPKASTSKSILKDNCKFMINDSLMVFESSMVKAMELIKGKADGFHDIKTSSATVTEDTVKKLIFRSLLGSKTVLTDLFPDCSAAKSESGESAGSFELFG